jgi:hypothetical protein
MGRTFQPLLVVLVPEREAAVSAYAMSAVEADQRRNAPIVAKVPYELKANELTGYMF